MKQKKFSTEAKIIIALLVVMLAGLSIIGVKVYSINKNSSEITGMVVAADCHASVNSRGELKGSCISSGWMRNYNWPGSGWQKYSMNQLTGQLQVADYYNEGGGSGGGGGGWVIIRRMATRIQ